MSGNYENITEVDLAYQILSDAGKDNFMHYRALILEILNKKGKSTQNEAAAISEVYTMINMDSRFQYEKDGMWGLTEWNPPEVKRGRTSVRTAKTDKPAEEIQE